MLLGYCCLLLAQTPAPCPTNNTPPADLCSDVCISCNFNGYTGSTAGYTGQTPPGFCGTIENEQWFAFIAGGPAATFTATPNNCQNGNGIQIALYSSCSASPIVCNGGFAGGNSTPVSITANLTPGAVHYLLIDGYAGDYCDFDLTIVPPSAVTPVAVGASGPIQGPDSLCVGVPDTVFLQPVFGAGSYTWIGPPGALFNGQPGPLTVAAPGGRKVQVQFGNQAGQICVQASNACFPPVGSSCKTIALKPSAPATPLPSVTVCADDLPYILPWGEAVFDPGSYQHSYNCDSVVRLSVKIQQPSVVNLPPTAICKGDSLVICGKAYYEAGAYSLVCTTAQGCDSTINFSFEVLEPLSLILSTTKGLTCFLPELTLNSAPSPGNKIWLNAVGDTLSTGNDLSINTPGLYQLQTSQTANGKTCTVQSNILIKNVTQPPPITATGGVLTAQNPGVMLQVKSLFSPVSYSWTGPNGFASNQQNPIVTVPGMYTVTVTDLKTGCSSTATVEVTQE